MYILYEIIAFFFKYKGFWGIMKDIIKSCCLMVVIQGTLFCSQASNCLYRDGAPGYLLTYNLRSQSLITDFADVVNDTTLPVHARNDLIRHYRYVFLSMVYDLVCSQINLDNVVTESSVIRVYNQLITRRYNLCKHLENFGHSHMLRSCSEETVRNDARVHAVLNNIRRFSQDRPLDEVRSDLSMQY